MNNVMPESTKQFLKDIADFPPLHNLSPEEIRKVVVANAISERFDLAGTEDVQLDGPHGTLTVRIYRPNDERQLPAIVFFHGGGFVFNRMEHTIRCAASWRQRLVMRLSPWITV